MNELTQAVYDLLTKTLVNPNDAASLRAGLENPKKMNKPTYTGLFLLSLDVRSRHLYGLKPMDQLDKTIRNEIKRLMRESELFIVPGWGVMQRRTEEVSAKPTDTATEVMTPPRPAKKPHFKKADTTSVVSKVPVDGIAIHTTHAVVVEKAEVVDSHKTSRITQSVIQQLTQRMDDREVVRKIRREIEHPEYMTSKTRGSLVHLRDSMTSRGTTHNLQDGLILREVERLIGNFSPAAAPTDVKVAEIIENSTENTVGSETESLTAEA